MAQRNSFLCGALHSVNWLLLLLCRLASRAMAVTNRVSANEVMTDGDLAKQYQSQLNHLRHHLSRRESGEEQSVAVVSLKQQVENLLAESEC